MHRLIRCRDDGLDLGTGEMGRHLDVSPLGGDCHNALGDAEGGRIVCCGVMEEGSNSGKPGIARCDGVVPLLLELGLRHTCAMHTLQATRDVRKVSLWLGHASLQSTEVYLRADPTEKLEALATMMPPALKPGRFRAPDKLMAMLSTAGRKLKYAE